MFLRRTAIPQNSGETQQDYCYRVCQVQAGPVGMARDEAYVECVIGLCVDCANSGGITQAQCQSACSLENYCSTQYNNCLQDSGCLSYYGCIVTAADQAAQNACASTASSLAQSLLSSLDNCLTTNGSGCVAP